MKKGGLAAAQLKRHAGGTPTGRIVRRPARFKFNCQSVTGAPIRQSGFIDFMTAAAERGRRATLSTAGYRASRLAHA